MHLTPQHFQAQRRYHEEQAARTLGLLSPFAFGFAALSIDDDSLRNGTLALVAARGVLPDGTVFHLPDSDEVPSPIRLSDRFSPTRDEHTIYLALAPWRPDASNVQEETPQFDGKPASTSAMQIPARYRARDEIVIDEATGADPATIRFASRNLLLLLDDELTDELISLPLAHITRDGHGQFQRDRDFVPPCLQIAASSRLLNLAEEVVALLDAKGGALVATLSQAPSGAIGGAASYSGSELATRWLIHAIKSAEVPLRHLVQARQSHPERLYNELARLAGALTTFSLTAHPGDVPGYDHLQLTRTFSELERLLRVHLDVVISARALNIPLQRVSDVLYTAAISDSRCFEPGVRWFLGVSASNLAHADLIDRVQRLTKTCASKFVLELVKRAFNGFATEHVAVPPSGLAPRSELTYFELTLAGPCALSLQETREIGVYVPEALSGAYIELVVLLPR